MNRTMDNVASAEHNVNDFIWEEFEEFSKDVSDLWADLPTIARKRALQMLIHEHYLERFSARPPRIPARPPRIRAKCWRRDA